ncbi:MAG: FAD-binding oxidoreductase [Pseudomonadota bacterium]
MSKVTRATTQATRHDPINAPYWWDQSRPPSLSIRAVPTECDVAVIGAGYTGLSAALVLARAGRSVQIFERERPGDGAATRNAGIVTASLATDVATVTRQRGTEVARAVFTEAREAWNSLAVMIRDEGIDCGFEVCGSVQGALWPRQLDAMAREAEFCQSRLGVDARTLLGAQVSEELGSTRYIGALVRPDVAVLDPARLHAGLLKLAMDAGARVHTETAVTGIRQSRQGRHELQTMRGRTTAREVLVATNGYTDRSDPWLSRRVIGIPSGMIALRTPDPKRLRHWLPRGRVLMEKRRMRHQLRIADGGRTLLFGGLSSMAELRQHRVVNTLRTELLKIFPDLEPARVTHVWQGLTGFSREQLPRLFERRAVRYVGGFNGVGIALANWLGRKAAWQILEDERGHSVFEANPPGFVTLYPGHRWFLPATASYLRLRDRLDQRGRATGSRAAVVDVMDPGEAMDTQATRQPDQQEHT